MFDAQTQPTDARWRAFGRAGDLDLDFQERDRALLVTRLLARCRQERVADAEATSWQLSLTARIAGLAMILGLTRSVDALPLQAHCDYCRDAFEVELSLAAISELAREAEHSPMIQIELEDAQTIVLRRPTGADQRRWQASLQATDAMIFADLLVSEMPLELRPDRLS